MGGKKNICIVSGEPSGDFHAAELCVELKKRLPGALLWGMGGTNLRSCGVETVADLTHNAAVGFWEVLRNLSVFSKTFERLVGEIDRRKPDCCVLVDYPGFNLKLASLLKKRGIPVIYYISPQLWAWGRGRMAQIRSSVDRMLVLFPFELDMYRKAGVSASFVGHPLLDEFKPVLRKEEALASLGLGGAAMTVSLLPGSRRAEVISLLPVMLKTCGIIRDYFQDRVQFLVLRCESLPLSLYDGIISKFDLPLRLVEGMYHESLQASDFAMVCSGTATLETAVAGTPMVIMYSTSMLTWMIARLLIRIPHIGLVNVVAGRKVAEEFIQFRCTPVVIADTILPLLQDPLALAGMRQELSSVRRLLGEPGASGRAASEIVSFLNSIKKP